MTKHRANLPTPNRIQRCTSAAVVKLYTKLKRSKKYKCLPPGSPFNMPVYMKASQEAAANSLVSRAAAAYNQVIQSMRMESYWEHAGVKVWTSQQIALEKKVTELTMSPFVHVVQDLGFGSALKPSTLHDADVHDHSFCYLMAWKTCLLRFRRKEARQCLPLPWSSAHSAYWSCAAGQEGRMTWKCA